MGSLSLPHPVVITTMHIAEGQAYVALSRVQRLEQLHLWCLHREALKGNPTVDSEYLALAAQVVPEHLLLRRPHARHKRHLLHILLCARPAHPTRLRD